MTLIRMLEASVAREPGAIAIVEGGKRLSYGAWRAEIGRLAGGLAGLGLAPGDHLVALLSNRREMASLYWACQETGIIYTPFNWRAAAADVAYVLADAEAKAVVYEERSKDAVLAAAREAGIAAERLFNLDDAAGLPFAEPYAGEQPGDDQATSLMLYTSGTTGRPKGVPRSHAAERAASITCLAQMHYRYGEVSLGVMPLFHTMGVRALAMSVLLNGNFVAMPAFDCTEAFRLIEAEKISALFLVPTMFHDMVHAPDFDDFDLGSARNLGYAGMTMTSALVAQCAEKFKPEIFTNFYGSSEIYTFSVSNRLAERPLSAGRPGIGQQLRVVRADADERVGPDEVLAQGETGEIIASMSALDAFTGYWKRPDADEKAIRGGWYFTGDLGRFDEEGEIAVLGRVDDMVISGGENIYPEEIEDLLAKSDLVRGVSVIGMADARWGQKIVAFIEPEDESATAEALDAYCLNSGLARFKRPKDYVFIREIPRSASGKLLRRRLRTGEYERLANYKSTL